MGERTEDSGGLEIAGERVDAPFSLSRLAQFVN